MFATNFSHMSRAHRYFNVKPSTYYFPVKMKMLAVFQICINANKTYNLKQIKLIFLEGESPT